MKRLIALVAVAGVGALALAQLQTDSSTTPTKDAAGTGDQTKTPVVASSLSVDEVASLRDLDARPIHTLTNMDLGKYLNLYERQAKADPKRAAPHERLGQLGLRTVGQPFRLFAGRFDLAESDCVVFVERTIAMSLATDWDCYMRLSERLRHKDGVVDYRNRNFFTLGDWMPNNAWLIRDITAELGPADKRPAATFTHVVRPKVFDQAPDELDGGMRWVFKGSDYKSPDKEVRTDTYIPTDRMSEVLADLRTGDVVLVLRPASGGNLGCDHMGMINRDADGQDMIMHSTNPKVRHEPLLTLLKRCNWVSGLKFLRLKDDARDLVAREVARLGSSVVVPEPEAQDLRVERMRYQREMAKAAKAAATQPVSQ